VDGFRAKVYPGGVSLRGMLWRAQWLFILITLATVYIFTTGVR